MKVAQAFGLSMLMGVAFLSGYGFRSALAQQSSDPDQTAVKLPPDIRPDTRSRLPWPTRDDFTAAPERQAFEHVYQLAPRYFVEKPTMGPTSAMMHLPVVGEAYTTARLWLREKSGLDQRHSQLAILVSARESNEPFQFLEHERSSMKDLPRKSVEVVRNRADTHGLDEKDAVLIQFGREMYQQPKVSSKTYAEMERLFGRRGTLAVTLLMAHYTLHSLMIRAIDQHMPPGTKTPFAIR